MNAVKAPKTPVYTRCKKTVYIQVWCALSMIGDFSGRRAMMHFLHLGGGPVFDARPSIHNLNASVPNITVCQLFPSRKSMLSTVSNQKEHAVNCF